MKNNSTKKEVITIRIKGPERVRILSDLTHYVSEVSGIDTDNTGAINWMLKQFDDDKITFNT